MRSRQQILIYQYIKQNPGATTREVVNFLDVDYRRPQMNIALMVDTGFLRKVKKSSQNVRYFVDKRKKI